MAIVTRGSRKNHRKSEVVARPIVAGPGARKQYREDLFRLNQFMKRRTEQLSRMMSEGASPAQILSQIERDKAEAERLYGNQSNNIANRFVSQLNRDNKRKFENMVKQKLGVDSVEILDKTDVLETVEAATAENVQLIKTIPEEHFDKVSRAVFDNFRGVPFDEGSLTNRLRKIGSITDRRAKFIARDQTAKFVGSINQARQSEAGIKEYIWRNRQDIRVVGNPAGLYPEGNRVHNDHWTREGKVFRWDQPPPDGHPGQPINCRCNAEPVINFEALEEDAISI